MRPFIWLLGCGGMIWMLLAAISYQSPKLVYEVPNSERPISLVTTLWIVASLFALLATRFALRINPVDRRIMLVVILFAIGFRSLQLFTPAFQEIDSYRYLWDGITITNGQSPYRYSPYQVLEGPVVSRDENLSLHELQQLALTTPTTHTILSRVHYSHVRTLYPPVSQLVFAATVFWIPKTASVTAYLIAMKLSITLFDLAIFGLLLYLLKLTGRHPMWALLYGWNPLVIKEFSNSGHLDSIAVFWVMVSVVLLVRLQVVQEQNRGRTWLHLISSSCALAAGFASKIYPVILFPFLLAFVAKRFGWKRGLLFGLVFLLASVFLFWPMLAVQLSDETIDLKESTNKEGVTTFLRHWQINELPYMLVYQNLRPIPPEQELNRPWFRIENESLRESLLSTVEPWVGPENGPYVLSRLITLGLFAFIYAILLFFTWRNDNQDVGIVLFGCGWILAIFFCLQPTQNPWYWTWVVPFLPFIANPGWFIYSGFLFVYYLRFSMAQYDGPYRLFGETYDGAGLFDYGVVFVEHLPVFAAVAWFAGLRFLRRTRSTDSSPE